MQIGPRGLPELGSTSRTPSGRQSIVFPNTQSSLTKSAFGSLGKIGKKVGSMIKGKPKDNSLNLTYDANH